MTDKQIPSDRHSEHDGRSEKPPRVIDAGDLFQGEREVWVELSGVRYRLRITRRNKLILQK
jgi:hemin uptake protein HemP